MAPEQAPFQKDGDLSVSFSGIPRPVRLKNCAELVPVIRSILHGWRVEECHQETDTDPDIVIERTVDGFRRSSRWTRRPILFSHPVDAACDFLVDLMKAYIAANRELLCLHCAAVLYEDGLVIFPSTYKAGKSTLTACLARSGIRLFTDDVLPIVSATGQGMAPGFLPRVRLPVPDDAALGLPGYVERHAGPRSGKFAYLDLGEALLAPLGETAVIRGAVMLDRDPDGTPELMPASVGKILLSAIQRNFSHNLSGMETLDRLHTVIGGAQCFRLTYRTAGEADAMLKDVFGAPTRRSLTA